MLGITKIAFKVHFEDGTRRVAEFVRAESIKDLLSDEGTLGAFLRIFIRAVIKDDGIVN